MQIIDNGDGTASIVPTDGPPPGAGADVDTLAAYVGAPVSDLVTSAWQTALELVDAHCGTSRSKVPTHVLQRAYLEVGAELFHRKATKNGVAQFALPDAEPIRIARDPMVAAYPLLRPYLPGGFA